MDQQFVCKPCHKAKTLSEKSGISYEQAVAEKQAIQIIKDKKDLTFLQEHGTIPARSQKARRQQIVNYILYGDRP